METFNKRLYEDIEKRVLVHGYYMWLLPSIEQHTDVQKVEESAFRQFWDDPVFNRKVKTMAMDIYYTVMEDFKQLAGE